MKKIFFVILILFFELGCSSASVIENNVKNNCEPKNLECNVQNNSIVVKWDIDGDEKSLKGFTVLIKSRDGVKKVKDIEKETKEVKIDKFPFYENIEVGIICNFNDGTKSKVKYKELYVSENNVLSYTNQVYAEVNGQKLMMDIFAPKENHKKRPLIVFIHGGAFRYGDKGRAKILIDRVVKEKQYVLADIQYRLSDVAKFPAQINDCKGAVRWLKANADKYNIDVDNVIAWGESAGAYLSIMLAVTGDVKTQFKDNIEIDMEGSTGGFLEYSSSINGCVAFTLPVDFLTMYGTEKYPRPKEMVPEELFIGGILEENKVKCFLANPINYISEKIPPILLMHSDEDHLIDVNQTRELYRNLEKVSLKTGKEVKYCEFKGIEHGGELFNKDTENISLEFIERIIKK